MSYYIPAGHGPATHDLSEALDIQEDDIRQTATYGVAGVVAKVVFDAKDSAYSVRIPGLRKPLKGYAEDLNAAISHARMALLGMIYG